MSKKLVAVWRKPIFKMLNIAAAVVAMIALTTPSMAVVFTNPAVITINDAPAQGPANPYPLTVSVSGLTGTTTKVTATLNNLNHTFPDDIDVMLVSPTGTNLVFMSDAGGTADALSSTVTFDDAGVGTIPDGGPIPTGTVQVSTFTAGDIFPAPAPAPSVNTNFAAFNGADPNGTWNLFIVDDLGVDQGVLGNGWSLTVTTTGSPATTFSNSTPTFINDRFAKATPYASVITSSGLTGAITDVNVTLTNFSHLNPDDLDILLIGPGGKRIILWSDAGGTGDAAGVNVTFDDAAATTIPDAGPVVTGTFRPSNFGTGDHLADVLPPYPSSATAGPATLASVFNGTDPNGTWELFVVDDATASTGSFAGGWSVDVTAGGSYGAKRFTNADFDGEGKTDVSIYRPSDGFWWTRDSHDFANSVRPWGAPSDLPVPADYDGDRHTDFAVFRPSTGQWIILNSATTTFSYITWGTSTDKTVPADYDGDGLVDVAIYRPADGNWWVRQSATTTTRVVPWGASTDIPLRGHFEGTSGADFAVFRPSDGKWYILNNAGSSNRVVTWGSFSTDELVPADYDCDGKTDVAIFRVAAGDWWIVPSSTGTGFTRHWGSTTGGDIAVPGDYDGDSCADLAVWRPSEGGWYIYNSGFAVGNNAGAYRGDVWGVASDTPAPATYVPVQ